MIRLKDIRCRLVYWNFLFDFFFLGHPILLTLEARHEDKAAQEFVKKQRVRTTNSWSQCYTMPAITGCCVSDSNDSSKPWLATLTTYFTDISQREKKNLYILYILENQMYLRLVYNVNAKIWEFFLTAKITNQCQLCRLK